MEKIRFGEYKGFTRDEVDFMAERGLLFGFSGRASKPVKEGEAEADAEAEAEEEEEDDNKDEEDENCLTKIQTREPTDLLSKTSSPPVKLPLCRPPTPEKSPPDFDFVAERSWELRVNQDLTLERRVYTFEGLLVRLGRVGSTYLV